MRRLLGFVAVLVIVFGSLCVYNPPPLYGDYAQFEECAHYCMGTDHWHMCINIHCLKLL